MRQGHLPGVVPVELVLARTERVAVCLPVMRAYPSGFELDLQTLASDDNRDLDPFLFRPIGSRFAVRRDKTLPPTGCSSACSSPTGRRRRTPQVAFPTLRSESTPASPVLHAQGGGGGSGGWRQTFWVWPLPPPGPLTFVVQWSLAAGIPITRHAIEATLILDAVQRAQVIFSDEDLPELSPS